MNNYLKIFITLIFFLQLSENAYTQSDRETIIHFAKTELSLSQVFKIVEEQSVFRFSYDPSKVPLGKKIHLPRADMTVSEVAKYLESTGVRLKLRGNHFIVKRMPIMESSVEEEKRFFTLRGYVRDTENEEVLIGSTVAVKGIGKGSITNGYGFYSLYLEEGSYEVVYSFIGYAPQVKMIILDSDINIDVGLEQQKHEIEEVTVIVDESEEDYHSLHEGKASFNTLQLKKIPGLAGTPDVIKSLQAIPGINFYSDGSTIFHVRGGARDQNLLLIDEAPVYNPAHMLGIFSVFSPEALNSVDVYRGDMPAVYGGRLSSVIDIKTVEGNSERISFNGNTGLVSTTLNLEGPVLNKKGSFFLSGRRSHLKWILGGNNESIEQLHFSDLNLKTNYRINSNNRIFFSFYSGADRFRNREMRFRSTGISWTNFAGNLRWNHVFGDRLFSNTSLIASNYDYNLYTSYQQNQRWNAGIALVALKSDFSFYINPENTLKFGVFLGSHSYFPGNFLSGDDPDPLQPGVPNKYSRENTLYISHKFEASDLIDIRAGLRLGNWSNHGETVEFLYDENENVIDTLRYYEHEVYNRIPFLEPRLSIGFDFNRHWSAKLAFSRNSQFEFLITNSISPFTSLEIWLPAGPNLKPMFSDQITLGFSYLESSKALYFDAEFFYKNLINHISYDDHANMLFNPNVETELQYGKGKAYGAEFILRKKTARWEGWVSYTWTRALLRIPEINDFNSFPARYDRPHALNLYSDYNITRRWEVSLNWLFSSGSPFTSPTGYYYYLGYRVPYYKERNNDRLPNYHRLDFATDIRLNAPESRNKHELRFSIFNLYGRKNPFNINFNKTLDENGNVVVPADYSKNPEYETTMMYMFRAIPSISYHFEF